MDADNINQNEEQNKVKLEKQENRDSSSDTNTNEPQKISVELNKYKTLIEALGNRGKVRRVVITIFFLGILLFVGISAITVAIKRLYPYSDITTNGLGATTIKSEKNEVSYWLFNTAILWANSGIHVDEGDIITIRASGKSHTAIHHLYDAASNNYEISDSNKNGSNEWVGSEGIPEKETGRGKYRRRFRIFPNMPSEALLMQVVQNDKPFDTPQDGNPDNFYFIGKERQHIYINRNGTLYFAVNDIVLNRPTIATMMWETIREKYNTGDTSMIDSLVKSYGIENRVNYNQCLQINVSQKKDKETKEEGFYDTIKTIFNKVFAKEVNDVNQIDCLLNPYLCLRENSFSDAANKMWSVIQRESRIDKQLKDGLEKCSAKTTKDSLNVISEIICQDYHHESPDILLKIDSIKIIYDKLFKIKKDSLIPKIGKMELGYSRSPHHNDSLICELSYYYGDEPGDDKNKKRKTVWFEDNIGSFLIVIEKTK